MGFAASHLVGDKVSRRHQLERKAVAQQRDALGKLRDAQEVASVRLGCAEGTQVPRVRGTTKSTSRCWWSRRIARSLGWKRREGDAGK